MVTPPLGGYQAPSPKSKLSPNGHNPPWIGHWPTQPRQRARCRQHGKTWRTLGRCWTRPGDSSGNGTPFYISDFKYLNGRATRRVAPHTNLVNSKLQPVESVNGRDMPLCNPGQLSEPYPAGNGWPSVLQSQRQAKESAASSANVSAAQPSVAICPQPPLRNLVRERARRVPMVLPPGKPKPPALRRLDQSGAQDVARSRL